MGTSRSGRIFAIITARGGSKGLPRKNIRVLAGKPLIAHSILAALGCPEVARCLVSTEDQEIKEISLRWGAEVIDRPVALADDQATSESVIFHVIKQLEAAGDMPDYLLLLQPTSPLRTSEHLTQCLASFRASNARSAISVTPAEHSPYKCLLVDSSGLLVPLFDKSSLGAPRQTLPAVYRQNGAIYFVSTHDFLHSNSFFVDPLLPFIMNPEESIDIDSLFDFEVCEMLFNRANFK